jgi:hypothetical protein
MMATLCQAYPSEAAARRAIERLRAGGLPPQGAQLITGGLVHDLRREPVGEFLGQAEPDAPVRTFASTTLLRWHPPGTFAGDADRQRAGSFADVDSHVIVHYDASGSEHSRVAGLRGLEELFVTAGLEPGVAEHALAELCAGSSLVLAQVAEMGPAEAATRLEDVGQAAGA